MAKKVVKASESKGTKSTETSTSPPLSPKPKRLRKTPHGRLADLYEGRYKHNTIYCRGAFYRYDNGCWSELKFPIFRKEVAGIIEESNSKDYRSSDVDSVEKLVKSLLYKPDETLDAFPDLINLRNGVYDTRAQSLVPHNPNFFMTTQLPFRYDPAVSIDMWKYYLESTFVGIDQLTGKYYVDTELIEFVQEAVGYSLTSDIKYHVMFWCLGRGRNGKGILFHILQRLGGDAVAPLDVNFLKYNQYQLATLAGKNIALCSESHSTNNLVEDSIVKMLVAGDAMVVRQIRQEPFTLNPTVKLWWSMNRFPAVADTSEGFWRRMMIIPFNRTFSKNEVILDLNEKLEPELSGIFVWAMEGLRRLQQRGRFAVPKQVQTFIQDYQLESNTVASWIEDLCDVSNITARGRAQDMFDSYRTWCYSSGYNPYGVRKFKREMAELGYPNRRDNLGSYYTGITLKPLFTHVP